MGSSQSRQKSTRSSTQKMNAAFSWQPGGERLEREALVLAGELVGGVDLDVAARAQRSFVGAAHHRGSRALARVEQSRAEQQRMREGRELRGKSSARAERAEQGRARERRKFDDGADDGAAPAAEGARWRDRARPRRVRDGGATPSYGACNGKSTRGREPTGDGAPGKLNGKSARGSEVNPRH